MIYLALGIFGLLAFKGFGNLTDRSKKIKLSQSLIKKGLDKLI